MKIDSPISAILLKRYKRFLADLIIDEEPVTAHVPNTGSMKSCWDEEWPAILSYHPSPKRKLPYTLEMTHNGRTWIGVNTARTNDLAAEGIKTGIIKELQGYSELKREYVLGESRIDILLSDSARDDCLVEVKNVTLKEDTTSSLATFPDSVTERGRKHLQVLENWVRDGKRAVMLYIIQREDVDSFSPSVRLDPKYAEALKHAMEVGVEILAYQCRLSPEEIVVSHKLPLKKW